MRGAGALLAVALATALLAGLRASAAPLQPNTQALPADARAFADGSQPVRVLLASGVQRARVTSSAPLRGSARDSDRQLLPRGCKSATVDLTGKTAAPLRLSVSDAPDGTGGLQGASPLVFSSVDGTPISIRAAGSTGRVVVDGTYRGSAEIIPGSRGLTVVSLVPVDDYLPGVLGAEIGADSPREALEAQAIAARSYVLYHALHATGEPFDIAATTSGQVYRGAAAESEATVRAARETRGEVLTVQGSVVDATYHAVSGGVTADPLTVWGSPIAGLAAVYDGVGTGRDLSTEDEVRRFLLSPPRGVLGASHPYFRWRTRLSADSLTRMLAASLPRRHPQGAEQIGRLQDIRIDARAVSGHISQVTLVGSAGAASVRGDAIRWVFGDGRTGGDGLRSTLFVVDKAGSRAPYSAYEFVGGGWGHGTGMSQAGAIELAQRGLDHRAILKHYYRLADLTDLVESEP